jgi:hypothetical protein
MNFLHGLGVDLSRFSGMNDGDLVPQKHCKAIADKLDKLKARLTDLMTCPGRDLLEHTNEDPVFVLNYKNGKESQLDIVKTIIETRLKTNKKMDPETLEFKDSPEWTVWVRLAYYLKFGTDFCRTCSKLGGFKQC